MKKLRTFMLLSTALFTCAVIISCSRNNDTKDPEEDAGKREVMSGSEDIEKLPISVSSPTSSYIMRLEDKILTLYEINGGEEIAVTAITIDPAYYPKEDIKALNQGVYAYSKEEGFAKLENFTN